MATEQDIWELVVKMTGRDELEELKDDLKEVTVAAKDLAEATEEVDKSSKKVKESNKEASKSTADFGRAALEGSRAMEDLQYGIGGVLNNVPNLVMMLGGPAGLAGAISLTAVGVTQLIKHWGDLMKLLGTGEELHQTGTQLELITKRIKEINDKEVKIGVDSTELEILEKQLKSIKEAHAEFEAAQKRQKGTEKESGAAVEQALAESAGGLPGVSDTLKAQFQKEKAAVSPELQEALAKREELNKKLATELDPDRKPTIQAELMKVFPRIREAYANVAKEAETAAGDLLKKAKEAKGPEQAAAQKELAGRLGGELGRQVTAASPEALAQADKEEDEFNRHMDRAKAAGEIRRVKAAATKKTQTEAMTKYKAALQDQISILQGNEQLENEIERLGKEATAKGIKGEQFFNVVARGAQDFLRKKLAAPGAELGQPGIVTREDKIFDVAVAQAKAARIKTEREETEAAKKAPDIRLKIEAETLKPFLARETATIKAGGFAEQAEAMLAQTREQGGAMGRRMTPDQQFEFVQRQAAMELKQRFPRMAPQQREDMATRITAMGQKNLNQRMTDLQAKGIDATQITQAAVMETLQAVQQLAAKVQREMNVGVNLRRQAKDTHNRIKEMGPPAQNNG